MPKLQETTFTPEQPEISSKDMTENVKAMFEGHLPEFHRFVAASQFSGSVERGPSLKKYLEQGYKILAPDGIHALGEKGRGIAFQEINPPDWVMEMYLPIATFAIEDDKKEAKILWPPDLRLSNDAKLETTEDWLRFLGATFQAAGSRNAAQATGESVVF